MKTVTCLSLLSACITANVVASPIVYRFGIDGPFAWQSMRNACWQGPTSYFDISQSPHQTGVLSTRTLGYSSACYLGMSCSFMFSFYLPTGPDVEIAGGGIGNFYTNCQGWQTTPGCPLAIEYNFVINQALLWQNTSQYTGSQGQFSSSFVGRFVGVRVRLSDGWHYGWMGQGGYALESEPDTAIVTPPCRTDTNLDGVINIEDYFTYVDWFVSGSYRARWSTPDEYIVDIFDYLDFLNDFMAGC